MLTLEDQAYMPSKTNTNPPAFHRATVRLQGWPHARWGHGCKWLEKIIEKIDDTEMDRVIYGCKKM